MMLIITANLMTSCFLCDSGIKLHSGNLDNGASHLWQRISSAYRPHGSHNYKVNYAAAAALQGAYDDGPVDNGVELILNRLEVDLSLVYAVGWSRIGRIASSLPQ